MPLEIVLGALLVAAGADFAYFTWWCFLGMVVAMAVAELPISAAARNRVHTAWMCTAVLVSLVLPVLSFFKCSLLVNTCTEAGPAAYVAGNFLLHYWPSVRAINTLPIGPAPPLTLDCATLAVVFVMVFNPAELYGCVPFVRWHFMLGAGVAGGCIELAFTKIRSWAPAA